MERKQVLNFHSRRAAIGFALGVATALGALWFAREDATLQMLGLAAGLGFALAGALRIPGQGGLARFAAPLWCILCLFGMVLAAQLSLGRAFGDMGPLQILLNAACAALPFLLLLAVTARPRLAMALTWAPLLLLAVANYCVFLFRGTELTPADLSTAGTGLRVASNYKFHMSGGLFASLCVWALIPFSGLCLPARGARSPRTRALALIAAAAVACLWYPACRDVKLQSYGDVDAQRRGLLASFSARLLDEFRDPMPEDYSPERVAALEARYRDGESAEVRAENLPDIIVIMDESFADMDVLGPDSGIGAEVIPFFQSLQENAIRGNALVSVYGGGTVHSEYAFLTGNALERLPQRTSVYSRYLKSPAYSLATELKRRGYAVRATHPYFAESYSRDEAYPLLGFDDLDFLDAYPREELLRAFVSDREMFDFLIDRYENRDPNRPLFLFGITMQNHGGYGYAGANEAPRFALDGLSGDYPEAEQYLGLLRESDRALERLISHFEGADSPVVIAFFGDHLPNVEEDFYRELHGGDFDELAEWQLRRTVPFAIWANYDIEERDLGLISLHDLGGYLCEAAGMELSPYGRFLRDMSEAIPAMNALGYYSGSAGKFLSYEDAAGAEAEWLDDYAILQYNALFDAEHRSEVFFPLPEDGPR